MLACDLTTTFGEQPSSSTGVGCGRCEERATRVLIVDDHVDTVDALQILLAYAGYDVRAACCGGEAISIAREFKPDLAILDILLPDMNGYDLALTLRTIAGDRGLRLIALSSCSAPDHALAACFDEIARKPIGSLELQRVLRRFRPR